MNGLTMLSGPVLVSLFFKVFGLLFSFMYFIYSVVVYKQIQTMSKVIQVTDTGIIKRESLIITLTNLQILVSLLLFVFSILIIFS